eukprot:TRINITY_DN2873_c0_g3_i2.p1 TRINITY_DN2873_c0_g3~~TRINITY_DN2873_c0_g3_i2.p1  ORF type:complete len:1979 (-),score=279.48 TRINITY_DN2873_c0_g3_i2:77-5701(-)
MACLTCNEGYFNNPSGECVACGNGGASYSCDVGYWKNGTSCSGEGESDTQTCQECNNGGASYRCDVGYWKNGTSCSGEGESDTQTCQECNNGGASYNCDVGYWKNGSSCSGEGEIDTQTCKACGNGGASYNCDVGYWKNGSSCSGGGESDTQTCQACVKKQEGCSMPGELCVKVGEEYFLYCEHCSSNFTLDNGVCRAKDPCDCKDTCVLTEDSHYCLCTQENQKLDIDQRSCVCEDGYFMNGNKCTPVCEIENPCGPEARCSPDPDQVNSRLCTCKEGFRFGDPSTAFREKIRVASPDEWDETNNCQPIDYCNGLERDVSPFFGCQWKESEGTCQSLKNGRLCTCPLGFFISWNKRFLEVREGLAANVPFGESFSGYCQDIDECSAFGFGELKNTTCTQSINSRTITCPPGCWATGRHQISPNPTITLVGEEEFEGCQDIDMCEIYDSLRLHYTCVSNEVNTRTITCHMGYFVTGTISSSVTLIGSEPFRGCEAINPCETENGGCEGICRNTGPGNRTCSCGEHATLKDETKCVCHAGYKAIGFGECDDVHECIAGCGPHSICTPGLNQRTCECSEGFHFQNKPHQTKSISIEGLTEWDPANDCIAKNVCDPSFGPEYGCGTSLYAKKSVECIESVGQRTCRCPESYFVVGGTGRSVSLAVGSVFPGCLENDYCNPLHNGANGGNGCGQDTTIDVKCTISQNSRICECPLGYRVKGYTSRSLNITLGKAFTGCEVTDQCGIITDPCGRNSICTSQLGFRLCTCKRGYHFKSLGNSRIPQEKLALGITIDEGGVWNSSDECILNDNCDPNLDDPPSGKFGCGGDPCVSSIGGRQCTCPTGYYLPGVGERTVIPDSVVFSGCIEKDSCDYYFDTDNNGTYGCSTELFNEMPVTCTAFTGGRWCQCPPGFLVDKKMSDVIALTIGEKFPGCTDVDECDMDYPCGPNASCTTPEIASRLCTCNTGFHFSSKGHNNLTSDDINTPSISISGKDSWQVENDCVENNHCDVDFDVGSTGGYGCGVFTYNNMGVECNYQPLGRTCTCPPGFVLVDSRERSRFFASGVLFVGCQDLDECQEYGYPEHSTCVNSAINERTITCDLGFFFTPPNDNVIVLTGNQQSPKCMDFNECNFGCADKSVIVACTDSTSNPSIPPNTRVCTCPNGYVPYGNPETSNVTLTGSDVFNGCIDCTPCPFNTYLTQECGENGDRQCEKCGEPCSRGFWTSQQCNSTVGIECSRCSECEVGYYIASPCTSQSDVVCLPCDPPCESPMFEARSCINGFNRVCDVARVPQCIDGCGKGICVDTNVCECPLSAGYYGPNCELNCHLTCLKYSATCEVSVHGRTWWCDCPPGSFPSNGNQKCIPEQSSTPQCLWTAWGEWNSCSSCGSTRKREALLIAEKSDASCGQIYSERKVCYTNCSNEDQVYVAARTKPESGAYHALSLSLFWQKNVAKYISAKHNVSLVVSDDAQADAFNEKFRIYFYDPSKYHEMIHNQNTKRDGETSDLCMEKDDNFDVAVNDVMDITQKYMEEVLFTPKDAISYDLQGCELIYDVKSPGELVVWSIFGGVVGGMAAIVLVMCLIFIWYKTRPVDLSILPASVRWQYEQYYNNSSGWTKDPSQKFYKKELLVGTDDFQRMTDFFYGYLQASAKIEIKEAYAIYNPLLVANFINYRSIITSRMVESPEIFAKQDWKKNKNPELKQAVYEKYNKRCEDTCWNSHVEVPILVTCHGTDWNLAVAIASTGFSTLSNVEVGWHGSGVYFTTYAMYGCPFLSHRADPALLISFVTPGNVFPVTENHNKPNNLIGKRLKPGYTSHYVAVDTEGAVPELDSLDEISGLYDEIVVSQEPQISPVYLIRLSSTNLDDICNAGKKSKDASAKI